MKNPCLFLCFLAVLVTGRARSQTTDTEFAFRHLKMEEQNPALQRKLIFRFDLLGRFTRAQAAPDASRSRFRLRFWLADAKGDTLVPYTADSSLSQSLTFFETDTGRYRSYTNGRLLKMPYGAFRKNGMQTFSLWAQARNEAGGGWQAPFRAGTFTFDIPKVFPLAALGVRVKDVTVSEETKKDGDKGVALHFSPELSAGTDELFSYTEDGYGMLFYTEFTLPDGSPATLPNGPWLPENRERGKYAFHVYKKGVGRTLEIFIPYTDFFLPEGRRELRYRIHAVSSGYTQKWERLWEGTCTVQIPATYFVKATVQNVEVREKAYDLPTKDLPVIGFFVPSSSKAGKGYPDLYWTLGNGHRKYATSAVAYNTFTAPDGSCTFRTTGDETLYLDVYDEDIHSRDDLLGRFRVWMSPSEKDYENQHLQSQDVINGRLTVQKRPKPAVPGLVLTAQAASEQGISGYRVWGNATQKDPSVHTVPFLQLPDGTQQPASWRESRPLPRGAAFCYFVPVWEYTGGARFGISAVDTVSGFTLNQKYVPPDRILTETRDVALHTGPPKPGEQNGIRGLSVDITAAYPRGLVQKDACRFAWQMKDVSGTAPGNIPLPARITGTPLCADTVCPMVLFVPYSALPAFSGRHMEAVLQSEVTAGDAHFVIGKSTDTVRADIPRVAALPKAAFSLTLKPKNNWSYFDISTGYGGTYKVVVKGNTEDGRMVLDISFPTEYVTADDLLSIVVTPYEFRTALPQIRWDFTAAQWMKTGTLALPKKPQAKKPVLKADGPF